MIDSGFDKLKQIRGLKQYADEPRSVVKLNVNVVVYLEYTTSTEYPHRKPGLKTGIYKSYIFKTSPGHMVHPLLMCARPDLNIRVCYLYRSRRDVDRLGGSGFRMGLESGRFE